MADKAKNTTEIKEPLVHIVKRGALPWWKSWGIRALAIVAAVVFVGILSYIVTGATPFKVYRYILEGVFGTERKLFTFMRSTAVLLIIALAVTPAFKMRFWNTGAEGQVLISAYAAVACMFYLGGTVSDGLLILIMFVTSILAGAIWAVIPAIFKAVWNTNETLFTLMMNYIAIQIVRFSIKVWVPGGSGTLNPIPYGNLPKIAGGDFWLSVIVALVLTVLMYIYLNYSKQGYEISVVGGSENTARYIGINVKKVIIRSLILSGIVCGIVGFLLAGGIDHTISDSTVAGRGFTAILVSWLGKFNPIFMLFTSALVNFLQQGTAQLMTNIGIGTDFFADVVIGIVFFFIIGSEFFINYQVKFRKSKSKEGAQNAR